MYMIKEANGGRTAWRNDSFLMHLMLGDAPYPQEDQVGHICRAYEDTAQLVD